MKMKLVEIMEKELVLETMIKSKGFADAVVSIGMDSDNVNVFVNSNELDSNTAVRQCAVAVSYSGFGKQYI